MSIIKLNVRQTDHFAVSVTTREILLLLGFGIHKAVKRGVDAAHKKGGVGAPPFGLTFSRNYPLMAVPLIR